jgi:benzodiazapine receptor
MPRLIISIIIPLLIGAISGFFTSEAVNGWYLTIQKPSFNPPNWIFAPVWTTLFILMGIAFYLIWKSDDNTKVKRQAMLFYGIQLGLNFFMVHHFFLPARTRMGIGRYIFTVEYDFINHPLV